MDVAQTLTGFSEKADEQISAVLRWVPQSVYYGPFVSSSLEKATTQLKQKNSKKKKKSQLKHRSEHFEKNSAESKSRNELSEKLRDKLAAMRTARNADQTPITKSSVKAKKSRRNVTKPKPKPNRSTQSQGGSEQYDESTGVEAPTFAGANGTSGDIKPLRAQSTAVEVARVTGLVTESDREKDSKRKRGSRKASKRQTLDKLLEKAAAEKDEIRRVSRTSGSSLQDALREQQMDKAFKRASGIVVRDNPSLIRKTIRNERRKRKPKVSRDRRLSNAA